MVTTFSPNRDYPLQQTGDNVGLWGGILNGLFSQIDLNWGGRLITDCTGNLDVTLNDTQCRNIRHELTGVLTGNISVNFTNKGGFYIVKNSTTGASSITVKPSGGTGFIITQGSLVMVFINPTTSMAENLSAADISGSLNSGASIAAAATTNILSATSIFATVTGSGGPITSFGTGTNRIRFVTFTGAPILTYNATSLILPTLANIQVAAGDTMIVQSDSSSNARVIAYQRATGRPLIGGTPTVTVDNTVYRADGTAGGIQGSNVVIDDSDNLLLPATLGLSGDITPTALSASVNDYTPTGIQTASVIRLGSNGTYAITGIVAPTAYTDGRVLSIFNISAYALYLVPQSASSVAANRFNFIGRMTIPAGQAVTLIYSSASSRWEALSPPGTLSLPQVKGLVVTGTSNTQATVLFTAAILTTLTGGTTYAIAGTTLTADISTSGANGLDTGTEAINTWYAVYIIHNPATDTTASLLSLSATTPTLPSGYTFFVRVGWLRNDASSNLYRSLQYGSIAQWVVGTNPTTARRIASGNSGSPTTPTWTAFPVADYVPTTAVNIALTLRYSNINSTAAIAAPNANYGAIGSATNAPPLGVLNASGGNLQQINISALLILESANVYYASSDNTAGLYVTGWVDSI